MMHMIEHVYDSDSGNDPKKVFLKRLNFKYDYFIWSSCFYVEQLQSALQ